MKNMSLKKKEVKQCIDIVVNDQSVGFEEFMKWFQQVDCDFNGY